VFARFLDEEVGGFGVDIEHGVVFIFTGLHDRFAQHLAHGIDGDIDAAEFVLGFLEKRFHIGRPGQVALSHVGLAAQVLHCLDRVLRIGAAGIAVVVHHHFGAFAADFPAQQAAQVLGAAGNQYHLVLESVVRHQSCSRLFVVELLSAGLAGA